ncbi:protein of unknown function [Burkholderia multivorans]
MCERRTALIVATFTRIPNEGAKHFRDGGVAVATGIMD